MRDGWEYGGRGRIRRDMGEYGGRGMVRRDKGEYGGRGRVRKDGVCAKIESYACKISKIKTFLRSVYNSRKSVR